MHRRVSKALKIATESPDIANTDNRELFWEVFQISLVVLILNCTRLHTITYYKPETFHLSSPWGNMSMLLPVRMLCPFLLRKFVFVPARSAKWPARVSGLLISLIWSSFPHFFRFWYPSYTYVLFHIHWEHDVCFVLFLITFGFFFVSREPILRLKRTWKVQVLAYPQTSTRVFHAWLSLELDKTRV